VASIELIRNATHNRTPIRQEHETGRDIELKTRIGRVHVENFSIRVEGGIAQSVRSANDDTRTVCAYRGSGVRLKREAAM